MSHVNKVLLLFPLLLLCISSSTAQTGRTVIPVNQNAEGLRDLCREAIAFMDAIGKTKTEETTAAIQRAMSDQLRPAETVDLAKGGACIGYIQGAIDGLNLAMTTGEVQKSFKACIPAYPGYHAQVTRPEGVVTMDELIRVTVKFIDQHPESLSNAAADVVWRAMSASYPCPAK